MNTWLIGMVTGIYLATAGVSAYQKAWGLSVMFGGYALANLGIIWIARGGR